MPTGTRAIWITTVAALALGGCASTERPILYPNAHLEEVGPAQAKRDIAACREFAGRHVPSTAARDVTKDAAIGAAGGAAVGAVTGAATGRDAGRGAAVGGAVGGTAGAVHGAAKQTGPSPLYKGFDRCLREKGYEVAGWQ